MSRINTELQLTNYDEFLSYIKTYGFSLNNFYDVHFEFQSGSPLYRKLVSRSSASNKNTDAAASPVTRLMRYYTDEAVIPGIQMSTGEYRINNTPQLKYAYGSVFSEVNFSFIMDADAIIKNLFDVWTSWIYTYAIENNAENILLDPMAGQRFRTRYRDDYAVDIVIIKYERAFSSKQNSSFDAGSPAFSISDIIPDRRSDLTPTKFFKAVPVHATRLFKAFPSNVSSVGLNSGTSELAKLSVSFDYESMTTTAITGSGSVDGNVIDPVNGGDPSILDPFLAEII